ncbi:T9SS type A sorting domain-containing protein [Prolixibacteraceae bacterium Z1-6]|uniref:T9SS type A sorting domain-containing protein n=1 Tax=Draconibacterium aestuarii TaxID=2998507 RepID=A0A9X3J5M4_9BACT|nr:T9SS type A sorting domain-containing protein [Prolixibacteraceae bacterium Z1-6]
MDGCTSADGINASLSDPNPPAAPTISVQNNCGESLLTASNYTGTLNWSTGESTESITVNVPGQYTLTQTLNGCTSAAATATATPKTIPTLIVTSNNPAECQGLGSLDFNFTGVPNGTYTITYDAGTFTNVDVLDNSASVPVAAGSYNNLTIEVSGCTSADGINASLSDPNPPVAPTISVQNSCGESVLTASNYTGTLQWSTGESTENIRVTEAGEYSLSQTVNGCTGTAATATATPKSIPTLFVTENNPAECLGLGSLDFSFTEVPDGNYTISYEGGSFNSVSVSGSTASVPAPAGAYNNLTITMNGCTSADGINASLSDPNPPAAPLISVQDSCGESVLTASGYSGTLLWSTGETKESITVTEAGEYSLIQTVNACTSNIALATATPKEIPTLAVSATDPAECQGQGLLEFTFTKVPNGTYTIAYDGSFFPDVVVTNNSAVVPTVARTYNNLTISVNRCTSANGVNAVLADPNPPVTPVISVQDNCGESILTASNYTGTLNWDTGESTESITVYTAREYTLSQTVTGCTSNSASIMANPGSVPTLTVSDNILTSCQGQGVIDFTFTNVPDGTYVITYDGGSFLNVVVSDNAASVQASAGTYNNLKITVDGCKSANGVHTILLIPDPPPAPDIIVQNNCGESVLTASNYTGALLWNTGDTTESITVTTSGEYSVLQTVNGCTSAASSAMAAPKTIPTLAVTATNPTECQGFGSLEFTFTNVPNGTYTITYNGNVFQGVVVANNKATVQAVARSYNNLRILVNECISSEGVNAILSDPNPPATPTITVQNNCGESVLTASNYTGTLNWDTGDTTESITVYIAREYTLTQTIDGCISNAASAMANPGANAPTPEIEVENNCGESIVTITNRIENAWLAWQINSTSDSVQSDECILTETGAYTITQKLGNCASLATVITVTPYEIPAAPIARNKEVCATDPVQTIIAEANAPDNTSVVWYNSATDGNKIESPILDTIGTVTYYAESENNTSGCVSSNRTPVTLTIKDLRLSLTDTTIIGKPNNNTAVLIFPSDSLQYQWYLNDFEITNATNQFYYIFESDRKNGNVFTVEVELPNGCKAEFDYNYSGRSAAEDISSINKSGLSTIKTYFTIYPNPTNTSFNIAVDTKQIPAPQDLTAKVYSVSGACVMEIPINRILQNIETLQINPGLYSVVLYNMQHPLQTKKLTITQH